MTCDRAYTAAAIRELQAAELRRCLKPFKDGNFAIEFKTSFMDGYYEVRRLSHPGPVPAAAQFGLNNKRTGEKVSVWGQDDKGESVCAWEEV